MPGDPSGEALPLETKGADMALRDVWRDGSFEGYAALFHHEDLAHDVIEPGAFRDTLLRRGRQGIRLLWQHAPDEPIGTWEKIHEDARGLFVRGRLTGGVARAREVLSLMRDGAVDGLSIGFRVTRATRDRRTGIRRLQAVDLWEVSVVTFPMQPAARLRALPAAAKSIGIPDTPSHVLLRMAEAARLLRQSSTKQGR